MMLFGRFLLALPLVVCLGVAGVAAQTAPSAPLVVVELFTSQGCSSCPASDQQLGELAKRPDVLALSLHVDYWDYIGWKDPFASPASTERQRGYARSLKQRYVYTPEMVFGGIAHDPGYEPAKIARLLRKVLDHAGPRVTPALTRAADKSVTISIPEARMPGPCDVWLVTFDRQHQTKVKRGENQGTLLTNYNVVRSIEKLDTWDGDAESWTVRADRLAAGEAVAVIVQQAAHGRIIGAARLDPPK
jgi:hypothetical protein